MVELRLKRHIFPCLQMCLNFKGLTKRGKMWFGFAQICKWVKNHLRANFRITRLCATHGYKQRELSKMVLQSLDWERGFFPSTNVGFLGGTRESKFVTCNAQVYCLHIIEHLLHLLHRFLEHLKRGRDDNTRCLRDASPFMTTTKI